MQIIFLLKGRLWEETHDRHVVSLNHNTRTNWLNICTLFFAQIVRLFWQKRCRWWLTFYMRLHLWTLGRMDSRMVSHSTLNDSTLRPGTSVTSKKSPNVYKSCPKMILLEKWMILIPLQKLHNNVGNLGKITVATGFKKLPKVQ